MKKCTSCGFENEESAETCTACGAKFENITETVDEVTEAAEEAVEDTVEAVDEAVEDIVDDNAEVADETIDETAETEITEVIKEKKPINKKAVRNGVIAVVIVIAVATCLLTLGKGLLSRAGIVFSPSYVYSVQSRNIQETEDSPKVDLGKAFDAFFTNEDGVSTAKWHTEKTDNGVDVKCETVCTFDGAENTVATYKVSYDYNNKITDETFSAGTTTLNREQTQFILKKIARYSDPAKKDFTTKELSSSRYNNQTYYFPDPYGRTLELMATIGFEMSVEEFKEKAQLPADMEGSTDFTIMLENITIAGMAALSNMTPEQVKTENGLDASVPNNSTMGEIYNNLTIGEYSGMSEEEFAQFHEQLNLADDITINSIYSDVKDHIIKSQYDMVAKMKAEDAALEQETSQTAAPSEETPQAEVAE